MTDWVIGGSLISTVKPPTRKQSTQDRSNAEKITSLFSDLHHNTSYLCLQSKHITVVTIKTSRENSDMLR